MSAPTAEVIPQIGPSGIPIVPKPWDRPRIDYDDAKHLYWVNGCQVASVTQVLDDVTPKPALTWWGMRVGLGAVIKLLELNKISYAKLMTSIYDEILTGMPIEGPSVIRGKGARAKTKTELEALVIDNKLSTNHIRDAARDTGTLIHDALTLVGVEERVPNILDFAVDQRGYIQAFCRWLVQQEPQFLRQEIITANPAYGYAGRWDLEAKHPSLGLGLFDFKTSKNVYQQHFEQLDLYEEAEISLGAEPHDFTAIVHLRPDGEYSQLVNPNPDRDAALASARLYWARQRNLAAQPPGYLSSF